MQDFLVQTSCGYGVPHLEHEKERVTLAKWAAKKGDEGLEQYWSEKNQVSIDGRPTGIFD